MAMSVTVASVVAKVRVEADIETSDQANSIVTDAQLVIWVNDAFREFYDILCEEVAEERFATTATINHTTGALPSDFMREIGIDYTPDGTQLSAMQFPWGERNQMLGLFRPRYRIHGGKIIWEPVAQTPTSDYTLNYIPTPATLASNGSFDAINGWDTYIVLWVKRKVFEKQDYDVSQVLVALAQAENRVRKNAARLAAYAEVISDSRAMADDWFFNG